MEESPLYRTNEDAKAFKMGFPEVYSRCEIQGMLHIEASESTDGVDHIVLL
jgi:hypothetical protein